MVNPPVNMSWLSASSLVCVITVISSAAPAAQPAQTKQASSTSRALPCGDYVAFQVLLDRQGFSVGEIDGKPGPNFMHAIAAAQTARNLPASGKADCDTWRALGGDSSGPTTVMYTVTEADVNGPFVKSIPPSLPDQAALPALGYTSPLEALAEKFHTSPAMLQQLNRGIRIAANQPITVPAVTPFDASGDKPVPDPAMADVIVTVTKAESGLRVTRADGTLVFFAPVTTGSERDPLPVGDWKVTGIGWKPTFNYNPDLFWDAKPSDGKATLKPGPNNPVGVVWVDVNIEHYGIHGTPEPARVGHAQSHGCVRLTNWDAARLAALVKPGTPVHFR